MAGSRGSGALAKRGGATRVGETAPGAGEAVCAGLRFTNAAVASANVPRIELLVVRQRPSAPSAGGQKRVDFDVEALVHGPVDGGAPYLRPGVPLRVAGNITGFETSRQGPLTAAVVHQGEDDYHVELAATPSERAPGMQRP